ncbi:UrcA family protein [Sandaracinobacteroides saxicola]|uniref:UrcA family protein n=1 Tax=Sandaracinobacteroides saxicola TaxID=2759707 RepID=A0A7G5ILY9_9SPHN|nr:UrcA family protein [Sandaracinobacteroides saxicola]QMW24381.1 UrcA family protein [Sandaracinobacteroides saxicola]
MTTQVQNSIINNLVFGIAAIAVSAATLVGVAGPAQAAEVHSVRVSHADLDLGTVAGRTTLENRIRQAAKSVCGVSADSRDLLAKEKARECMVAALEGSRAAVTAVVAAKAPVAVASVN